MTRRSDVAPDTLPISLEAEGVEVGYQNDRSVFYHGVPTKTEGAVTSGPGKDVHVLVTDPTEEEGVMVYVNDRTTHDDILESSGVGRVVVDRDETVSVFPGVEATNHGHRIEVAADPETARGRVFVFAEDAVSERSYEIVREASGGDENTEGGADPVGEQTDGTDDGDAGGRAD